MTGHTAFRRTVGSDVRTYAGYEGYLEASQRIDWATSRDDGSGLSYTLFQMR